MAFTNTPDSELSSTFAILLGRAKGEIKVRISKEIDKLRDDILNRCVSISIGDLEQIENLSKKLSSLEKNVLQIQERAVRIQRVIEPLNRLVTVVNLALRIVLLLPVPATTQTAGSIVTFSDQLRRLRELLKQFQDSINSINIILGASTGIASQRIGGLIQLINLQTQKIKNLQQIIKQCKETGTIDTEAQLLEVNESTETLDLPNSELYTSNTSGISYRIEVVVVDSSQIAPLRKAIALDQNGIIRFEGTPSFSSSTQVLIQELKFKIDNNIL